MIHAKEVCLEYSDGTLALNKISFEVKPGELLFILGPSGSGKTSILKLLMGMEYPTEGFLRVLNHNFNKIETNKIRLLRRQIGPVFQDFRLISGRNALENVLMGIRFLGMPFLEMKTEALNALTRVGLEHKTNTLIDKLSWGERQRVAIARAIARKPKLILADEPTGNLDHSNAVKILNMLASFKDEHTSVIITTHATHLLGKFQDYKCLNIKNGKIVN